MHARITHRRLSLHVALGLLLGAALQPAAAEDDVMVVTGSRVARGDLAINSPVLRIDREAIERSGAVNIEDLIRQFPQTVAGVTPGVNLGNPGVATVNLRGLKSERTLVLVDGKRFVAYDYGGIVDMNNIPVSLVDSIEIVTGGASAVYGSDAMAGVVNIKLKRDFTGLDFGTRYSRSSRDDGDTRDFSFSAGANFGGGRGNAVFNLGWTDRNPLGTAAREFSRFAFATSSGAIGGSQANPEGTLFCLPSCFPNGIATAPFFISFAPNGDLDDIGDRLFNYNAYNYLQVPQERLQGTGLLNFNFSDRVEGYARLSAIDSRVDSAIAPSGTFFTRTFDFSLDSPFLSAQARQTLTDRFIGPGTTTPGADGVVDSAYDTDNDGEIDPGITLTEYFAWRALSVGRRETLNHSKAAQAVAGLRGSLAGDWRWDAYYQHGRTRLTRDYTNDINEDRMQASMLGCPPGSPPGCVPGNFFGAGNLSAEAADFIRVDISNRLSTVQQVLALSTSGTLGDRLRLPRASAIGAALGVEHRREKSDSNPDDCLSTPGCSGGYGLSLPVSARYNVTELFGELLVPLVENARFADRLALETGVRFSDYSNIGNALTYKLGGSWSPLSSAFRVRGLYQRAVRAPNIFEFGSPVQQTLAGASGDPCANAPTGALRALCLATGVPLANIDDVPDVIAGQINVLTGGNPDLREETSDTYTAGLVWSPGGALEGASLQLDWYRIEISNAISTLSPNDVLQACYSTTLNPTLNPASPACALILRNPVTGGLVGERQYGISNRNENIALLRTSGVDLTLDYRLETATLGRFDVSLNGTRVFHNQRQSTRELPVRECAGQFGSSCGVPDPKLRFRQETVWTVGEFDLGYRWRYLKGTAFDNPAAAAPQFQTVGDRDYVDLMLGWKPARVQGLSLRLGVNNLLDRDPPLVGEDAGPTDRNSGNTYPGTFDVLGRTYFISATLRL